MYGEDNKLPHNPGYKPWAYTTVLNGLIKRGAYISGGTYKRYKAF